MVRFSPMGKVFSFTTRRSGTLDWDCIGGFTLENHILLLGTGCFEHIDMKFIDALDQIGSS